MGTARQISVPCDEAAEQALIGVVVGSPRAARQVAAVIAPEDFYAPAYGRVLEVATQLEHLTGEERRVAMIARLTGVPERELARVVDERPCAWDTSGALARRVLAAGCRRRAMALAAEIYNEAACEPLQSLLKRARELTSQLEAAERFGDMGGHL